MPRGSSGTSWEITRNGHGKSLSLSLTPAEWNALNNGCIFNLGLGVTPAGALDYFVYIKNTSDKYDFVIDRWTLWTTSSVEQVSITRVTGTPGGSLTDLTVNQFFSKRSGSGVRPDIEAYSSTDITGLTTGGTLDAVKTSAANVMVTSAGKSVVIPPGDAIGFLAVAGSVPVVLIADFYTDMSDPKV